MSKIYKKIHYCWFGGSELPRISIKCIESWKKYLSDFEIIRWDETNFNINSNIFVKQAYEQKKYAFVSDYVRMHALYSYGGIYLDTDVEILKDFSDKLENRNMVLGFEDEGFVMTAFIYSKANNLLIKNIIERYNNMRFVEENGEINCEPNTIYFTKILENRGLKINNKLQVFGDEFVIYPNDAFCAFDMYCQKYVLSKNTVTVHHCNGSWLSFNDKFKAKLRKILILIFGKECFKKIKEKIYG